MSHRIIELLVEYELAVSELYRACAAKFPDEQSFWNELAEEEVDHAFRIRMISEEADAGYVEVDDKVFAERPVESSIEYAREITQRVLSNGINLLGVLSLAYDIESSLIESEYYKVFKGDSLRFNAMIREIHMESAIHKKKIGEKRDQLSELNRPPVLERWD